MGLHKVLHRQKLACRKLGGGKLPRTRGHPLRKLARGKIPRMINGHPKTRQKFSHGRMENGVKYVYDRLTGLGIISRGILEGLDVIISEDDRIREMTGLDINFAVSLSHENYLNCIAVDRNSRRSIHSRPSETFAQYLDSCREPAIRSCSLPNMGGSNLVKIDYLSPSIRRIISGMISFLIYLQSHYKKTPRSINLDDFVIQNDVIKYCGVNFTSTKTSDDPYLENWNSVAELLRDHVFSGHSVLPTEISILITTLRAQSCPDELMLSYHPAILQPVQRITLFKSFYKNQNMFHINGLWSFYRGVLNNFTVPQDWNVRLLDIDLPDAVVNCLWGGYGDTKEELLRCVRNLGTHLHEHLPVNHDPRIFIGNEHVDVMISNLFMEEMIDFMELASNLDILHYFDI